MISSCFEDLFFEYFALTYDTLYWVAAKVLVDRCR